MKKLEADKKVFLETTVPEWIKVGEEREMREDKR